MEDGRAQIDPVRRERREGLVAEHADVGLLGDVVVERLPLAGDRGQLAPRGRAELGGVLLMCGSFTWPKFWLLVGWIATLSSR